jgi:hypothetical protein
MRLLKHYESGLPAWAIVLPSYGLFYRWAGGGGGGGRLRSCLGTCLD